MKFYLTLFMILFFSTALAHPGIPDDVYQKIEPYLIPEDHPIKRKLDKIFTKRRVIADEQSLLEAGFKFKKRKSDRHIYVAKHPKLKKYLLKFVLDSQIGRSDAYVCVKRTHGVNVIEEAINQYQYQHLFKVPKKWVYILPDDPAPPSHYDRKHMILVVEKMNILDDASNRKAWLSSAVVTKKMLDALFHLISELGLIDSVYIDNIPFCSDRKIALIDTEHVHLWPVRYRRLTQYLSEKRKGYWMHLVQQHQ